MQSQPACFPLSQIQQDKRRKRNLSTGGESDPIHSILLQIGVITTSLSQLHEKLDKHIDNCQGVQVCQKFHDEMLTTQQALLKLSDPQFKDMDKLKFDTIKHWGTLHRKRKEAYYECYAAGTEAHQMEDFLSYNPPYIMREFRPKHSPGESEERYKVREEHSLSAMMVEIKQKRITVKEQKLKYEQIDKEVTDLLNKVDNKDISDSLKALWSKEVASAEEKSVAFWNKKKSQWWKDLPQKYPYEGYKSYAQVARENLDNSEDPNPLVDLQKEASNEVEEMEEDFNDDEEPFIPVERKRSKDRQVKLGHSSSSSSSTSSEQPSVSSISVTVPLQKENKKPEHPSFTPRNRGYNHNSRAKPYDRGSQSHSSTARGKSKNGTRNNQQVFQHHNKPKGLR